MVCRLCLTDIPQESVIKLYTDFAVRDEKEEVLALIEKYLEIKVCFPERIRI